MTISERLKMLRQQMQKQDVDFYYVSNTDPHQNEYLPAASQRYQYISGFTGSNAEVLVGLNKAYLWTDGRYTEQAKLQVPADLFEIFTYTQGVPSTLPDFVAQHLHNVRLGVDPQLLAMDQANRLQAALQNSKSTLVFIEQNLIDKIWPHQPLLEIEKVFILTTEFAGESPFQKLKKLRAFIKEQQQEAMLLNDMTHIAWLFNLRGSDTPHTPLFFSYALVTLDTCILFAHLHTLPPKVLEYLKAFHIDTQAYQDFYSTIAQLCPMNVILENKSANQAMYNTLSMHNVKLLNSPIALWKACKNEVEIHNAKAAHRLDALALIRFFNWLEKNQNNQTELSVTHKLLEFRKQAKTFKSNSFETIAGYGPHGAIIHYQANSTTNSKLGKDMLFLLDSGGQYIEGTTDVTRTIHLGEPTEFEKHCYTLVLKGHLALRQAIFAENTRGEQLDILARQFLFREGYNYAHGTGHGVGAFLGVHEGPQRISTGSTSTALQLNMVVSNEPGIYLPGQFGIRIENLVYVKKAILKNQSFGDFYTFEDLTLVPYARNLIDKTLLTQNEIDHINAYHDHILQELSSSLDLESLRWLIAATERI